MSNIPELLTTSPTARITPPLRVVQFSQLLDFLQDPANLRQATSYDLARLSNVGLLADEELNDRAMAESEQGIELSF